jgi:dipeptidase E
MKRIFIILLSIIIFSTRSIAQQPAKEIDIADKTLFVYGGQLSKNFLRYTLTLAKKSNPKVCFIPTASGDNPEYIDFWNKLCKQFSFNSYVLKIFSVSSNIQTFEEQLLQMDVIIVGAGNTVNMLAIWKAQGIDTILRKAYDKGIVIAGGSAGSLCWFSNGYTGSRPLGLTKIDGLGFLNFSHCPHYHSDPKRLLLYQQGILNGDIFPGYACDDLSGLLFVNGILKKSVSQNKSNNNYFVSVADGKIKEELLKAEILK